MRVLHIKKMPIKGISFCLALGVVAATSWLKHEQTPHTIRPRKDKLAMMHAYWEQEWAKMVDPNTQTVPTERLMEAERYMQTPEAQRMSKAAIGLSWKERGPKNVGGRTRGILFDRNVTTNKKVWAGGVGGGLWYTNDITATNPTWVKVNDFANNLAVSTMAQSQANPKNMFFGTGEGWGNSDAIRGVGIFRSTDGGTTWAQLTSTNNDFFYYITKLAIDKTGIIYATTSTGIYKSSDNGNTWTRVLATTTTPASVSNLFQDVEIAADGSIYATCRGQVWKSNRTTHGANVGNLGNWQNVSPTGSFARIELATAPSNSSRVYVLCQGSNSNDCTAIFSSENGGTSWTSRPVPTIIDQGSNSNFTRGQAWYDLIATVDPNNADIVYIGGVDVLRTTNKGANWTQITTWSSFAAPSGMPVVHADHHNIIFVNGSSTTALLATDGGIYYSTNINRTSGYPAFAAKNSGYNVTQYYAADLHPTAGSNYMLAGAQDNGSHKFNATGINSVTSASGGDGAFCHINQTNGNIQITSYVYSSFYVNTNGGSGNFSNVNLNGGGNKGRFINPSDYDDAQNILYFGDNGGTLGRWSSVGSGSTYTGLSATSITSLKASAIKVDPNTSNRVWVAFSGSGAPKLVRFDNANATATVTNVSTGTGFPTTSGLYISSIDVQRGNANHLLMTASNYGAASVYETTDGGTNWTNIEGNLPDMPIRWGIFNPKNSDQVFLATELGVWSTDNLNGTTTQWFADNSGLANVRVDMLQYRTSDYTMIAATHGRGVFSTTIPGAVIAPIAPNNTNTALEGTLDKDTRQETAGTEGGKFSEKLDYQILQNPFQDVLNIRLLESPRQAEIQLMMTDFSGRTVRREIITAERQETLRLSVADLSRGVYILSLWVDGQQPISKKVMKQ